MTRTTNELLKVALLTSADHFLTDANCAAVRLDGPGPAQLVLAGDADDLVDLLRQHIAENGDPATKAAISAFCMFGAERFWMHIDANGRPGQWGRTKPPADFPGADRFVEFECKPVAQAALVAHTDENGLPPVPPADGQIAGVRYFNLYTLRQYGRDVLAAARAAASAPKAELPPTDGWLIDGSLVYKLDETGSMNAYEVNVTMAQGSRKSDGPRLALAEYLRAVLAQAAPVADEVARLNAEVASLRAELERLWKARFFVSQALHNTLVGNQSAWIEWRHGAGAESAMEWIHNGLAGPGLIPEGKDAQAWFDEKQDDRYDVPGRPELADAVAAVAAQVAPAAAPAPAIPPGYALVPVELARIGELLRTQDNRYTDQPMFTVQQRRRITGLDPDYGDNIVWLHSEDDFDEAEPEKAASLEAEYQDSGKVPSGWMRTGYVDQWEFVTACFTEQGCKDYLALDGHNLKEPRIYADGSYRNNEFRAVRNWLMSLPAAPAPEAQ